MRFRRDDGDGGFGMGGMGGSFGTSGYDPHTKWEGSTASRGVMREDSRVPHEHEDEHPQQVGGQQPLGGQGYRAYGPPPQAHQHGGPPDLRREHGGFSNYAGGGNRDRSSYGGNPVYGSNPGPASHDHFSERAAHQQWNGGGHNNHFNALPHPTQQSGYGQSQFPYGDVDDRGPHYGKGPKGYKRSDDRIREEVCELMSRQGYIDASDVEVTVESGVVRLVGTVGHRQDKRGLELIADRVHGVDEVRNELRLRKTEQASTRDPVSSRGPVGQNVKNAHS